jgi:TctA family transporter
VALAAGFLGYVFRATGYSLAGIILGFVLGPVVDQNLGLALQIYGPEFVLRPITGGLLLLALVGMAWSPVKGHRVRRKVRALARAQAAAPTRTGARGEEDV